ncbi:MAG: VOC family protein [Microthrixaceae bacterium]
MIKPSHVGLCTPDLDATTRFFVEGLGFEAADGWDLDSETLPGLPAALEVEPEPGRAVSVRSQMVQRDGFAVELLGYTSPRPSGVPSQSRGTIGLTHLAFWVDDLDACVATALAAGGTLVESTRSNPGVELVFMTDPAGVRIEMMELPT